MGKTVKQTGVFVGGVLGFIVMAALLAGIVVYGLFQGNFLGSSSIHTIYLQFVIFGTIACCAVLTTRAKGPDLSIGAVMAVVGVIIGVLSGSWIGIVVAVLCCITIGAANGALIVYLKMPSLLVTLVMTAVVRGAVFLIGGNKPLMISIRQLNPKLVDFLVIRMGIFELVPLIIFAAAFITVFLMILLSKLGKPFHKREASDQSRLSYFLAYVVSSLIAGVLGTYMFTVYRQQSRAGNICYTGDAFLWYAVCIIAVPGRKLLCTSNGYGSHNDRNSCRILHSKEGFFQGDCTADVKHKQKGGQYSGSLFIMIEN
jgi:predicted ABC-type sugar transport system permease subunit